MSYNNCNSLNKFRTFLIYVKVLIFQFTKLWNKKSKRMKLITTASYDKDMTEEIF